MQLTAFLMNSPTARKNNTTSSKANKQQQQKRKPGGNMLNANTCCVFSFFLCFSLSFFCFSLSLMPRPPLPHTYTVRMMRRASGHDRCRGNQRFSLVRRGKYLKACLSYTFSIRSLQRSFTGWLDNAVSVVAQCGVLWHIIIQEV